jgi:hypothetical protein
MAAIDWYADVPLWTKYLRDQEFRLSLGDDLRTATLAERLRQRAIAIPDATTAARLFGPIVCRNADDQRRLPSLLESWAEFREQRAPAPLPITEKVEATLSANEGLSSLIRRGWIAAAGAAVGGTLFVILKKFKSTIVATPWLPAPGDVVMREYGFTVENVCKRTLALLR